MVGFRLFSGTGTGSLGLLRNFLVMAGLTSMESPVSSIEYLSDSMTLIDVEFIKTRRPYYGILNVNYVVVEYKNMKR